MNIFYGKKFEKYFVKQNVFCVKKEVNYLC